MWTGFHDLDDTFRAFDLLQRRLDRAFDHWAADAPQAAGARRRLRTVWPATNVFEAKESFVVKAEVPGVAESDVAVSVEDDALVIRGERKSAVPEGYTAHWRERSSIAFTRKLPLPTRVDADQVSATLKDGVLTVTLPKAKDTLPRQIAVKAP
jgi:HSP20 family protein